MITRRGVQVMEMDETPLDTNWRKNIHVSPIPKRKRNPEGGVSLDPDSS
jgi:hypothetical protein